jgi:hypothetical protein
MILYVCIVIDQTHCNSSFRLFWYVLLKTVSKAITCQGWKIKKEKENIYQFDLFHCCTGTAAVVVKPLDFIPNYLLLILYVYILTFRTYIVILTSNCIDVKVSLWWWSLKTETCKSMNNWNKKNLHQSHWTELFNFSCMSITKSLDHTSSWEISGYSHSQEIPHIFCLFNMYFNIIHF